MTEAAPGGPVRWQDATVASLAVRTPRIKSVVLSPSRPFGFRAGQHVDIRLTAEDGYRAVRSYSIASGPETTGTLELAIERLDDGEVSPFFHDVVAAGDVIEVKGPLGGHFVWPGADAGPVLLVGGGSGVAPLMSMVRHRAAIRSDLPTVLLLSARTWDDVLFRDELIALAGRGDGFSLVLAITREAPRRLRPPRGRGHDGGNRQRLPGAARGGVRLRDQQLRQCGGGRRPGRRRAGERDQDRALRRGLTSAAYWQARHSS